MFQNLKTKWGVGPVRFFLIICVFAIGGSLAGFAARKLLAITDIGQPAAWVIVYIISVTLCWPVMVLLVSLPFGQYGFFSRYLARLGKKIVGRPASTNTKNIPQVPENQMKTINLAIFASGAGSNALKIMEHFAGHPQVKIALVACNKPGAGVVSIAEAHQVPVLLIEKERFFRGDSYIADFERFAISYIILAGFLWKVPAGLIARFPMRIINIHPALLPKYGGKGMYGHFVHEAVIAAGEKESGITIHFVDEQYDHGATIYQGRCAVLPGDTPDSLASRIQQLEYAAYPQVIEKTVLAGYNTTSR
ncbi:MAG: phosphoribosylglycinamide formyltransferase [Flavihumibacter sp.]